MEKAAFFKKLSLSLCMLALMTFSAASAGAIDFKVKGWWLFSAQYGQNGNFTNKGHAGYDRMEDDFEARSRVRIQLDAVASENLSGQVYIEIGKFIWGKASNPQGGAALGADSTSMIKLKRAYLDWVVPETKLKVRMGIQAFRSPFYALDGPTVLTADGAGITASLPINDNVSVTGFWMRPYNDNYVATSGEYGGNNFMDNMDIGGLIIPLHFDGWAVTPWGIYGAIGPNTFRNASGQFGNRITALTAITSSAACSLSWLTIKRSIPKAQTPMPMSGGLAPLANSPCSSPGDWPGNSPTAAQPGMMTTL